MSELREASFADLTIRQVEDALSETEHSRISCSDEKPGNWYTTAGRGGHPRCQKCLIMKAASDPEFAKTITITRTVDYTVTQPSEDF